jgi:hypothetical protein
VKEETINLDDLNEHTKNIADWKDQAKNNQRFEPEPVKEPELGS